MYCFKSKRYYIGRKLQEKVTLYWEKSETVKIIMSECSNLAQKDYKNKQDMVGGVIH